MRFSFKKKDRILKRYEYVRLSNFGRPFRSEFFIAVVAPGSCSRSRLGITVSRKVGGAVRRNRIKRLAREYFRHMKHLFRQRWDINLIVRNGAADQPNKILLKALIDLFARLSRQIES